MAKRNKEPKNPVHEFETICNIIEDDDVKTKGIDIYRRYMMGYIQAIKDVGRFDEAKQCTEMFKEFLNKYNYNN